MANSLADDSYGDALCYRRVEEFPPAFLSEFDTKVIKFTELGVKRYRQENNPEYVCRQLICKCGEDELLLLVSSVKNKLFKRMFTGKEKTYQPLVLVHCPRCESSSLVFDQQLHGWDAMFHKAVINDREPPEAYNAKPYKIYLGLSYYWLNYYDQAVSEVIEMGADLENYVDHLDFFFSPGQSSEFAFGFTCASAENYKYGD